MRFVSKPSEETSEAGNSGTAVDIALLESCQRTDRLLSIVMRALL